MNRDVTWPLLLRPPVPFLGSRSDFSGCSLVMSSRETTVWNRRVGVVGLYVLIGMLDLRPVRRFLAGLQFYVRFLPIRPKTGELAPPALLAFDVARPDMLHFHFEQLFYRRLHLHFVSVRRNLEAQRALGLFLRHALFGNQRPPDDFMDRHRASASESFAAASCEIRTRSWPSR